MATSLGQHFRTTGSPLKGNAMPRLNIEVIPPNNEQLNQVIEEISRKYANKPLTPQIESELQREAARLVRRCTQTKVTLVR